MANEDKKESVQLNKYVPIYNLVFGIIVVIGGLIGYFKANSVASLAAGLFFGNCLMLTIWGTNFFNSLDKEKAEPKYWGYYASVVLSVALLGFFIMRIMNTGKLMPALIVIPLAVLAILGNIYILHQKSIKK